MPAGARAKVPGRTRGRPRRLGDRGRVHGRGPPGQLHPDFTVEAGRVRRLQFRAADDVLVGIQRREGGSARQRPQVHGCSSRQRHRVPVSPQEIGDRAPGITDCTRPCAHQFCCSTASLGRRYEHYVGYGDKSCPNRREHPGNGVLDGHCLGRPRYPRCDRSGDTRRGPACWSAPAMSLRR